MTQKQRDAIIKGFFRSSVVVMQLMSANKVDDETQNSVIELLSTIQTTALAHLEPMVTSAEIKRIHAEVCKETKDIMELGSGMSHDDIKEFLENDTCGQA